MPDFTRINAPRIAKIEAIISTIRKSARSQKISDEDVAELLAPVAALVCGPTTATTPAAGEINSIADGATVAAVSYHAGDAEPGADVRKPRPIWRDPPHIEQIAEFVASLPSEQLSPYITHLVNRLCERADKAADA